MLKKEAGGWNFGATLSNLGTKIGYTDDANQKDHTKEGVEV